jgi:hypothetical protein
VVAGFSSLFVPFFATEVEAIGGNWGEEAEEEPDLVYVLLVREDEP